jgi:hypothetical protein
MKATAITHRKLVGSSVQYRVERSRLGQLTDGLSVTMNINGQKTRVMESSGGTSRVAR